MSLFCFPSAASSTIRARCTSRTLVSFERTSLVSSPRSSSVNTISVATRTIAPNYLAVVLMTLPNPDKFHQEQNTTLVRERATARQVSCPCYREKRYGYMNVRHAPGRNQSQGANPLRRLLHHVCRPT